MPETAYIMKGEGEYMSDWWIFVTDNIGVAAAAVSGAMIAIERKLDLFGVFLLGMITALGGGILRDVLVGEVPPRFFKVKSEAAGKVKSDTVVKNSHQNTLCFFNFSI